MEVFKINFSGKLVRGIISRLMMKAINKKFGYKTNIRLSELTIKIVDEQVHLRINADVEISQDEFVELIGITKILEKL